MVRKKSRASKFGINPLSMALVGALVAPLFAQGAASAQSGPAPEVAPASTEGESSITPAPAPSWGPTYHHKHQFGLSVMPGTGYRMIVPYKEGISCGDFTQADKRVCTARSPTFLDLEASFGLTTRLDLVVATRLGIERDWTKSRQFAVMPGFRIWLDQDDALKFFTVLQAVLDQTGQLNQVSKSDYGARVALGFMYDPIRNIGFFTQLGATFGFKRWFRIEADLGAGVQVRFP